ncbi:MAG: TM1266 family iron-only hydrogenase system putative regulator [Oscillibacter sp.]|nr:TM1266 family iron-only hydrogenase system putative regulator [Oscillibacter sp.]
MENRVAVIAILVRDSDSVEALNGLLHEFGQYIIGRMGVPYPKRGVNIISVAVDAPQEIVSALSGKIGRLNGVTAKTVYAPAEKPQEIH